MRIPFKEKNQLNKDAGSTLIVVLVAVSFLAIIGAIIMSVSSANLRMKQIEYAAKQNFYVDEIGLDDIYNGVGRDVAQALAKAYSKILIDASETGRYKTQTEAYIAFTNTFYDGLVNLYGESAAQEDAVLAKLNSYISRNKTGETLEVESYSGIGVTADEELTEAKFRKYIIKDVKVKYIEDGHYESVITTDIVIEVPYISFFQDFSLALDYVLIGNEGIEFKGSSGAEAVAQIEGNVYAGIATDKDKNAGYRGYLYDSEAYDGMNFYRANVTFKDCGQVVSRGDINICESAVNVEETPKADGSVPKEKKTNLWAENIRTVENGRPYAEMKEETLAPSTLKADANIFVADDLELNAKNSNVALSGNYYGYNFNNNSGSSIYNTEEKTYLEEKYSSVSGLSAAHATSSSIIVNANHSTLDLSQLNTLMVAGVAYLDIKDRTRSFADLSAGEASELRTGESIAMRYNQGMYLAPADILKDVSNPQENGSTNAEEVCPFQDNTNLTEWFGYEYLNKDGPSPVVPVVYIDNGKSYTYYYLKFAEGREKDFVAAFMAPEVTDPGEEGEAEDKQKWAMKQYMQSRLNSADIASHVTMTAAGEAGGTKIYTTGLLTDTGEENKTLKKNGIDLLDMVNRSNTIRKHYEQLYLNLNANMVEEVEADKRDAKKKGHYQYPLDNFIDVNKFEGKVHTNAYEIKTVKDAKVWIYEEVGGVKPSMDLSGDNLKGIVLCDGDLEITGNGGSFEGVIIATGRIRVSGNVTLKSNRGIVQAVLEAEQRYIMEAEKEEADAIEKSELASNYFQNTILMNLGEEISIDMDTRITGTEYTDYVYYKNWQKGERSISG